MMKLSTGIEDVTVPADREAFGMVVYSSAGQSRVLPAAVVLDVAPARPAAPLPFAPTALEGLVETDGRLAPQWDLPQAMGGAARAGRCSILIATTRGPIRVRVDAVSVVGFSLGGLLAAWIAQHERVERVIAIAPFLGIAGIPQRLTPALVRLLRARRNRFLWWDPLRRERMLPARGYPRYATHAIATSLTLAGELAALAVEAASRSPITLVANDAESAVNNGAIRRLAAAWRAHGSTDVTLHRLSGVGPSHDIIEFEARRATIERSYPALLALLDALCADR